MMTTNYYGCTSRLLRYDQQAAKGDNWSRGWKVSGNLQMAGYKDTPVMGQGIVTTDIIDWDKDGDFDIVLGTEPFAPEVVINKGDNKNPVWSPPQTMQYIDGRPLEYLAPSDVLEEHYLERCMPRMVDWDNDGVIDMIAGSIKVKQLFLRGQKVDGMVRFERPIIFTVEGKEINAAHRVQPDAVDYDKDGNLDLIALNSDNVICLWKGKGTIDLSPPILSRKSDGSPLQLAVEEPGRKAIRAVDWNSDSILDLVIYDAFNMPAGVILYMGVEGGLKFDSAVTLHSRISYHNGGIDLVDWNNDGYLDVITGGDSRQVWKGFTPPGQIYMLSGEDLQVSPDQSGTSPSNVFLVETYRDGRGNQNFSSNGIPGYSSFAVSDAIGCKGTRSAYGGDTIPDIYTFSFTPGEDASNYSIPAGTDVGNDVAGNDVCVSGFPGGGSGLYNVYVSWPYSTNISGGLTHISITSENEEIQVSVNQDGDSSTATPGSGEWVLVAKSVLLSAGTAYTVKMRPTEDTFVSMRAQAVMWEPVSLTIPSNPTPTDNKTDVSLNTTLRWTPALSDEINSQVVFASTDPDMLDIVYIIYASGNSVDVPDLKNGYRYYWRVDTDGPGAGTLYSGRGPTWTFVTNHCINGPGFSQGDLNEDCRVDFEDLFIITKNWLF
jgi:hypothetical protein